MYARLLFVVVSVLGRFSVDWTVLARESVISGGLARPDTADIRFAHE
jgi:hypothetical protein